jgi:two-component system sensor histidine kinase TctE
LLPWCAILLSSAGIAYAIADHFVRVVHDRWLSDAVNSLAQLTEAGPDGVRLVMSDAAARLAQWDAEDRSWFRLESQRRGAVAGSADVPLSGDRADAVGDTVLYDARIGGERVRVARIALSGSRVGEAAQLLVAETTRKRARTTQEIVFTLLVPEALLAALASALMVRAVRRSVDPLGALAAQLNARSHAGFAALPVRDAPLEVQPLVVALNDLLAKLQERLRVRQDFLATAAHDLRTPLAAALLHLEQARGADPASVTALQTAQNALRRAVRATQQVLDFAHAESLAVDPARRVPVDLCEVARQIGAELAPAAVDKGLSLSLEPSLPQLWVTGQPDLIATALGNLLDNAVKYTPAGGRVTVSVLDQPSPSLRVSDDGPGLPAAWLNDPSPLRYMRGSNAVLSGVRGAGLGLAIAHEVAARHGGRLELSAGADGHGCVATLHFPDGARQDAASLAAVRTLQVSR